MKCLSVRQPWVMSIFHGGKDIENRSWATRYTGPLAIHASAAMTLEDLNQWKWFVEERGLRGPWLEGKKLGDAQRGGILGVVDLTGCTVSSTSPWFVGEYGWKLANPRPVPFIPLKGQLGLFTPPDEIAAQIKEALK